MQLIKYFQIFFILLLSPITFLQAQTNQEIPKALLGYNTISLKLRTDKYLKFTIDIFKEEGIYKAFIQNGEEKLYFDQVEYKEDTLKLQMYLFDSFLAIYIDKAILSKEEYPYLQGKWVRLGLNETYEVPFVYGSFPEELMIDPSKQKIISGKWAITFTDGNGKKTNGLGVFEQYGSHYSLKGTILTPSGDYRYLEGKALDSYLTLSTFDMSHAYLLEAKMQVDGTLKGEFWSGKSGYKTWTAVKDENAKLPDADQITFLKEGYDQFNFSFPNLEKQLVSIQDERYKGKVVVVQLLGSWCPNCMDETAFLSPWYKENKSKGVEVIGLAYEVSPDFEIAKKRVEAMKKRFEIEYELLIAGTNNTELASKTLPMLNKISAFPTTIFIDKKGKVRKIHTGFSGPGTGAYYDRFKKEFDEFIEQLVKE